MQPPPSRAGDSSEAGAIAGTSASAQTAPAQPSASSATVRWIRAQAGRLAGGSAPEQRVLLFEAFAGREREWSLADATRRALASSGRSDTVLTMDKSHNQEEDILDDDLYEQLLACVKAGLIEHLWLALCCESYTAMWLRATGHHPFRSRSEPDGITPMPPEWRSYADRHNEITRRTAELATAQEQAGGSFYIENPADQGRTGSPCYNHKRRRHVPVWITSPIRRLAKRVKVQWATTHFCRWRGRFHKPTTICAGGPNAGITKRYNKMRCDTPRHESRVTDVDEAGQTVSKSSGEYPPGFCAWTAASLVLREVPPPHLVCKTGRALAQFLASLSPTAPQPADDPIAEAEAVLHDAAVADGRPADAPPPPRLAPAPGWRSAHEAIPSAWPEKEDVQGEAFETVRSAPLRFVSRRRAEPESAERLARQPLPRVGLPADTGQRAHYRAAKWPASAPPRPVRADQLWLEGVYDEILEAIDAGAAACRQGQAGSTMPKVQPRVFGTHLMQPWAREVVEDGGNFDLDDPDDVCILLPYSADDPAPRTENAVNPAFFTKWAAALDWKDEDMVAQVTTTAIESRSACTRATIIHGHHRGLRENFAQAEAAISEHP